MKKLLFLGALLFANPANAQDVYSGTGYERLNLKGTYHDTVSTYTGVELGRHAFEIGAFTSFEQDGVRLHALNADGYLYTDDYKGLRGFLTTGTVVMDVQIDGLGNKTKIFPRGGAGLEYSLTDRLSLRGTARYNSDWSYGLSVKYDW